MQKSAAKNILAVKSSWQQQLAQAITDPLELLEILEIDARHFPQCKSACEFFPLKVPYSYLNNIKKGDIKDPLLLQVMASNKELVTFDDYSTDPVGDLQSMPVPGLLHKYNGRVLLITTGACAIHCRYCFRRHFPYSDNHSSRNHWQAALDYIQHHNDIDEVILSGGDPLLLADDKLSSLFKELGQINHLKRLRIHTRLPVVLPARITDALIKTLQNSPLQICIVIHVNHAQEIASDEQQALIRLNKVATLLNQSVLLKDINDSLTAQKQLSERLFEANVLPYYLHLLDPVQGAAHFESHEQQAKELIGELRTHLPGYLVPRLVREIAGENSKTPIFGL
jgi:L-lysine 2,3-aminomutase